MSVYVGEVRTGKDSGNCSQRATHPRRDFEIEDKGVLHLDHNWKCAICSDRPRKSLFLPCVHYGCCIGQGFSTGGEFPTRGEFCICKGGILYLVFCLKCNII